MLDTDITLAVKNLALSVKVNLVAIRAILETEKQSYKNLIKNGSANSSVKAKIEDDNFRKLIKEISNIQTPIEDALDDINGFLESYIFR